MEKIIVVHDVVDNGSFTSPYWASDHSLPKVRARFKRLTGKFPSSKASIIAFQGTFEDLDRIVINDMGDIECPKSVTRIVIQ